MSEKKLQIRNSTSEFLIFTRQAGENGIEVRVEDGTVWLTQKLIGVLFDKGRSTITEHLGNIFETCELDEKAVCRNFRHTAEDGKEYTSLFYNLDAIIAVGFRVNSARAVQFRQWATGVLRNFALRGYVLDKERLKNGAFLSKEYFDDLLAEIREIRATRNIPMTMEDWAKKLNAFLQFNEREILDNPGKVSQEVAKAFAGSEFEEYRILQDGLFESDFDRYIKETLESYGGGA
ncbi:MAG: RhuM family protein [Rectinemataceae bacterium]|nr:RhuM family protein [Rectinemataceae bacterium]